MNIAVKPPEAATAARGTWGAMKGAPVDRPVILLAKYSGQPDAVIARFRPGHGWQTFANGSAIGGARKVEMVVFPDGWSDIPAEFNRVIADAPKDRPFVCKTERDGQPDFFIVHWSDALDDFAVWVSAPHSHCRLEDRAGHCRGWADIPPLSE